MRPPTNGPVSGKDTYYGVSGVAVVEEGFDGPVYSLACSAQSQAPDLLHAGGDFKFTDVSLVSLEPLNNCGHRGLSSGQSRISQ